MWKSQFIPLLLCHDLMGIIDGSEPCPPLPTSEISRDAAEFYSLAADYQSWLRRDQLTLSWILSSLTEEMCPLTVGLRHSK